MRTFIDEAGIFIDPAQTNLHKVSVVGGLVIPDDTYESVLNSFRFLKQRWGVSGEVKGNELNETQVNELIQELQKHNVLFDAVITDAKFLNDSIIAKHKLDFSTHLLNNISPYHHPNLAQQIRALSTTIPELSDQLYIQSLAMTSLIHHVHQYSTLFYVQRFPKELSRFKWIIDAKQHSLTKAEKWWTNVLKPVLQGMSIKDPLIMLNEADYSHYQYFDAKDGSRDLGTDINKVMADLTFCNSKNEEGLQLADILTTSLRKALNGKFQEHGWKDMGKIMIQGNGQNVLAIVLGDDMSITQRVPYFHIIHKLNRAGRQLIPN